MAAKCCVWGTLLALSYIPSERTSCNIRRNGLGSLKVLLRENLPASVAWGKSCHSDCYFFFLCLLLSNLTIVVPHFMNYFPDFCFLRHRMELRHFKPEMLSAAACGSGIGLGTSSTMEQASQQVAQSVTALLSKPFSTTRLRWLLLMNFSPPGMYFHYRCLDHTEFPKEQRI